MATSGYRNVTVTTWDTLRFSWTLASQDVAKNTSRVTWKLELIAGSDGAISSTASKAWSVTVNGTKYSGTTTIGIDNNATKTLASGATTIAHNADGTKTFSYSFSQEFNITFGGSSLGTFSGSSTGTLETIPRASQPSLITWPETTNDVGNFGDTISIHMNRNASTFTHTVRYAFGSLTGTIATGVTTGTTWTIPLSFMDLLPAATKGSGLIYVDTYSGSTLVGTKYTGFTAHVPDSVVPTCTVQVLDATDYQATYGNLVRGLSKLYVKVNGYTTYSSPIAAYRATANGSTFTAAEFTTDVLHAAGTTTVSATVTDRRGRTSAAASASFPVLDYAAPMVSALAVQRCLEDGTESPSGAFIKATFSAAITALNDVNSAAYTLRYKAAAATSYTEVALTDLAGTYTVSGYEYIFAADTSSSFIVEVEATDDMSTATRSTHAPTAFVLMDWGKGMRNMGIGKVAEQADALEIGLDVEFFGQIRGTIFDAILPVGSMVMRYDHIDPGTLYPGTTWARVYGAFPWFTDANGQIGTTGGERTVTLTEAQMPAHDHGGTYTNAGTARTHAWLASGGSAMGYDSVSAGGGEAHNNMPPYIQVSAWRRTG